MANKVYGFTAWHNGSQRRCIVSAPSMAAIGRLLDRNPKKLFCLCETGNKTEIAIASAKPGAFFVRAVHYGDDYAEVDKATLQ